MMARAQLLIAQSLIAQVQLALMLLTRLPAGQLRAGQDIPPLAQTVWAYPLVGAIIGAIGAGVLSLGYAAGLPAGIAATLAALATIFATGGLHEDGLADVADGFGGGRDTARKLEIMRDSRIGSYGALALILALGLRVQALAALGEAGLTLAILALIAVEAASRAGLAALLYALPSARALGLGQSAAGVGRARMGAALALGAGAVMVCLGPMIGLAGGFATLAAIAVAQTAMGALALRQVGGQTGDVLGAAQVLGAAFGLLAVLALLPTH